VLRIRDIYPDARYRIRIFPYRIPDPGSKKKRIADPQQRIGVFLTPNIVTDLSEIRFRDVYHGSAFFPHSGFPDPDPEVEKTLDPGSGSETLPTT
jgi:hypothetical protein